METTLFKKGLPLSMLVPCLIIGFNWLCLERVSSPSLFVGMMCETVNSSLKYSWSDHEKATFAARSALDGKGPEEGCQLFQRNTRPPHQLHHPPTQA